MSGRKCNGCGKTKAWEEFYKTEQSNTGHYATCKECIKVRSRANYRKKNKKRLAEAPIIDGNMANAFLMGRL